MSQDKSTEGAPPTRVEELERSCRRMIKELDEKSEQVAIINGILRLLASDMQVKDVLQVFANNLKTLCPYDQISIALFDAASRKFLVPFVLKVGKVAVNKDFDRSFQDEELQSILERPEPVLRRHLKPDEMKVKGDTTFVRRVLSCELMVPLNLGERRYGILMVSCFDPDGLREEHVRIVSEIAPAVAVAIHTFLERNQGKIPYGDKAEE